MTTATQERYYLHRFEVWQERGGPEEGGWWYQAGTPVDHAFESFAQEDDAVARCRELNEQEYERRKREEQYDYTSVLSDRSTFYSWQVDESPKAEPYPEHRPHYE